MQVYVAIKDVDEETRSVILGAFSAEENGRDACQEDADETVGEEPGSGAWLDETALTWRDDSTESRNGVTYTVRLLDLDVRTYA